MLEGTRSVKAGEELTLWRRLRIDPPVRRLLAESSRRRGGASGRRRERGWGQSVGCSAAGRVPRSWFFRR
jgi:hypothetical protein